VTEIKALKQDRIDHIVSSTKSVVGAVPMVGTLLGEIVSTIVPNQRIDRITKYLAELEERLETIEEELLATELKNEECVDLIEEGFVQASRAITDDRRVYIANVIANGISSSDIEYYETKFVLKIIQELNEQEVIWLRSYLCTTMGGDEEFREKYQNILEPTRAYAGSSDRDKEKAALQESYKQHLHRLNLIAPSYSVDHSSGLPEFDKISGQQSVSFWYLTALGRLVLKLIGLYDETITNKEPSLIVE